MLFFKLAISALNAGRADSVGLRQENLGSDEAAGASDWSEGSHRRR